MTDAQFSRGVKHRGGIPLSEGVSGDTTKSEVTLILDNDLIEHFRAMDSDWTGRIDDVLRSATKLKGRA